MSERYLQPRQAQQRPATLYEDLLGDAIERAFAGGAHELPALVERLNREGLATPSGQAWTTENYCHEMQALDQ